MTNYYKPITWSKKHRDLDWVNAITSIHDLQCSCDTPLEHTINTIVKQEPNLRFTKEDKQLLQKCLTSGDQDTTTDAVDGFGDGELEKLFAEDVGEDLEG